MCKNGVTNSTPKLTLFRRDSGQKGDEKNETRNSP